MDLPPAVGLVHHPGASDANPLVPPEGADVPLHVPWRTRSPFRQPGWSAGTISTDCARPHPGRRRDLGGLRLHQPAPEPPEALREFLGSYYDGFHGYPFAEMTTRYRFRGVVHANWKIVRDAFLDTYHFPVLHRYTFAGASPTRRRTPTATTSTPGPTGITASPRPT